MNGSGRLLTRILPATILSLLTIGYIAHLSVRETALDTHRKYLEQIAAQSSLSVAVVLRNVVDNARVLAGNELVTGGLVEPAAGDGRVQAFFGSLRVPGSNGARVTLTDDRGRRIVSSAAGADYAGAAWISDVATGREVVRTDSGGMLVAVPAYHGKPAMGFIVIEFDASGFSDLLRLPVRSDGYAVTTISGNAIHATDNDLLRPGGDGADNDGWLSVGVPVPGFPNLSLVAGDRMSTVLAPVQRRTAFVLATILLGIAAVAAGVFAHAFRYVKPVRAFVAGCEYVGKSGDLSYRIEPAGDDEFRRLTAGFNAMLAHIEAAPSPRGYTDDILDSMHDCLLVVSSDGCIRAGNPAMDRILGRRVKELRGRHVSTVVSGDWSELAALGEQDTPPPVHRTIAGTGGDVPVRVSVSPMSATAGDSGAENDSGTGALILVLQDITQEVQDKAVPDLHDDDMERVNADLEQFAYVASHDLKAPLRAIDNLAGWIEEDAAGHMSEESREHMTMLRGRIARLEALLEGLLRYARAGRDTSDISWVDTGALVSEVVEMLEQPDVVHVAIPENMPRIRTSATGLRQVFRDLIGNAVKHHDRDEVRIQIDCRDLGALVEFSVIDDGPGIPERYHDRIFQLFQTLKRRDEVEGSGLGLAMARKLVRTHGGEIDVVSCEGERGSVFRFTWANLGTPVAQFSRPEARHAA